MGKHYAGNASPVGDKRRLADAIQGDVTGLMEGLCWTGTPQGADHWCEIFLGKKRMSKRSRRYLNKVLNEAKAA